MKFNYIDLFAGIGGFHLGLLMAGFEFNWVGFSEINKYAIKVYEKNFPNAENLGDITKIDGYAIRKKHRQIDLITGGFPCQDISIAGKGTGITGTRSGLWKEMFWLICEIRPRYVIVENVPALLGRGLNIVLGDLASCGYDAEWDCISASAFGAHHQRDRIWIVAYACSKRRQQISNSSFSDEETNERRGEKNNNKFKCDCKSHRPRIMAYAKITSWNRKTQGKQPGKIRRRDTQSEKIQDTVCKGLQRPQFKKLEAEKDNESARSNIRHTSSKGFPDWAGGKVGQPCPVTQFERSDSETRKQREIEYNFCGMAYGVSRRVDRLKCLGNAVVPQVIEWIGRRLLKNTSPRLDLE